MQHNIKIVGFGYNLRPATIEDSAFILSLRNDANLSRYLNATSNRLEDQESWYRSYEKRAGDYYFIIEDKAGNPEGTIGIYDVNEEKSEAEWGRWILKPQSMAATESVWLMYSAAFSHLKLASIYCRTVSDNEKIVSFHDSCGLERNRILPGYLSINGKNYDAVEHSLKSSNWPAIEKRLALLSQRLATRFQRSGPA